MLLDQAAEHYESLGWTVTRSPELRIGNEPFRPELIATKGPRTKAIRVDEDPFGKFQIGMFAAACKRRGFLGVVICPVGEEVVAACEEMGVEYLSPEGLGRAIFLPRAGPPVASPAPAKPVTQPVAVAPVAEATSTARIPWWRWGIVAVVWTFAIYFVVRLVQKVSGG